MFAQMTRRLGALAPSPAAAGVDWSLSAAEAGVLVRKSTLPRVAFAIFAVLVAWPVAPHAILLGWLAFIVAWELGVRPSLEAALEARAPALSATTSYRWLAALHFVGACGYAVYPVTAWFTGTAVGFVVATAWVCATANHAFVYFAHQRLLLCATLAPLLACALIAPFTTTFAAEPVTIVGMLAMTSAVIIGGHFGHDRNELLVALSQARARHQAAEDANAAKSQFMALMSHELRTPLNAVIGYAELIEQDAPGPVADDARRILKAAHRQLDLINAIIDMARLDSGTAALNRAPTEIAPLLDAVRRAGAPLAEARGNRFEVRAEGDPGSAVVDAARLEAAVMRLVSNAAKFTEGGSIVVTARRVSGADGRMLLEIRVADTGPGLTPAQAATVFDPFVQGDGSSTRLHEGAGLGLAAARQAARLMGGDITCESTQGAGAVFTLTVAVDG